MLKLEKRNEAVDVRHKRRALTPEEFKALVSAARHSGKNVQGFDGEIRARIYILSAMTGLRRKELGSLTPESFCLDAEPPTLTVLAQHSKHRKEDTLPLHSALIPQLHEWLKGCTSNEPIFPKLATRKTWLMVKKDLELAGIAYENQNGIADFHAAGRHTYITELLRNGVTLPEARELARHSDINMTMKYAHIGLDDQAKAIQSLPTSALQMRCESGVSQRHSMSSNVTAKITANEETPVIDRGYGSICHTVSCDVKVEDRGTLKNHKSFPCMGLQVSPSLKSDTKSDTRRRIRHRYLPC